MSEGSRDEVKEGVCVRACVHVPVCMREEYRLWFELRGKWGATSVS